MFVIALLAATLAAPVPKFKPKTVDQILIGRWEMVGIWKRATDATFTPDPSDTTYEFQFDGVVLRTDGPRFPVVTGTYTLVEPDAKHPDWRVTLLFAKDDDSGQWTLKEVSNDQLKVIDGIAASKDVYARAKGDKPKK
jgi:hypothetical protein